MKNIFFAFLAVFIFTLKSSAQECNCSESFDWMKNTFEKNDAGFQYYLEKKGENECLKHYEIYKEKAKTISNLPGCLKMMNEYLLYFRPGHIGVYSNIPIDNSNLLKKNLSNDSIRLIYKNEKTIDLTEKQLINILDKKQNRNPIEGIWDNGMYTIGVISDTKSNKIFNAFIIKADSIYWMPKQRKAVLTLLDDNKTFSADFLMRDHSLRICQAKLSNKSGTVLYLNNDYWKRKYPKNDKSEIEKLEMSFLTAKEPFVEKISDKTIYLRIPSFDFEQREVIESVLAKYNDLITSTPNLIIDIRNGTGGSTYSYEKLMSYCYTQPIRNVGQLFYATELNAQGYENYTELKSDTSRINGLYRIAAKMRANLGQFISMNEETYGIDSSYNVLPFPRKIGILCNHNNGSADECFLMQARQSTKVKIFGVPTFGAEDFSNLNIVSSPNGQFSLSYSMTKSLRVPNYCIDGIGIQPDFYIDDAIDILGWIEYTKKILEQQK